MPVKLEKTDERKWVKDVYKDFGAKAVKFTDPSCRGAPDRIVFIPGGLTLFIEQKRGNEPLREEQKDYHEQLRGLGFPVVVCRSAKEAYDAVREGWLLLEDWEDDV